MALNADQAAIADAAIERVRASVAAAQAAVESRSSVLTWITGSSSAAAAGEESLRQSRKILATLEERRPGLEPSGLVSFVELAQAGAEVSAILESARLATAGGFAENVIAPTVADLKAKVALPALGIGAAVLALVVLLAVAKVSR